MFKIALINPILANKSDYLPTGLCYLSSYLKKYSEDNNEIKIFNVSDYNIDNVLEFKPDLIGFTSFSHTYNYVCQLSEKIKKLIPKQKIIIGGSHISMAPWSMPNTFDYGILGEGEKTFLRLVRHIKSGGDEDVSTLSGVQFYKNKILHTQPKMPLIDNLDKIPFPDRDSVVNLEEVITSDHPQWFNRTHLRSMQVTTSRGCPFKCVFCQPSVMWETYRVHSPEYIAEELFHIHSKYGINAVLVEDDLFTSKKQRVAELIELLGKKNLLGKIIYYVAARTHLIDEEWTKLLKTLGVVKVEFGIESGSDEIAAYLKQSNTSNEINKRAINMLNDAGISVFGSFIAGSPYEKMLDLKQTFSMVKWIKKNYPNNSCGVNIATPLPGTELWNFAIEKGLIIEKDFDWDKLSALKSIPSDPAEIVYLNQYIPAEKIIKLIKRMNLRLLIGTPREFIIALPRRLKKLIKRIIRKLKI